MQRDVWSTSVVRGSDRFGYWNDVICEAVLNVEASSVDDGDFSADLSCNRLALGNFVHFRSEPHRIERSRRLVRFKPDDSYLISLQMSGLCHVRQGETEFTLGPGDIGVVNADRTMRLDFEQEVHRIVTVLPRRTLEAACSWLSPNGAVRLARGRPTTRLLTQLISEMASPEIDLRDDEERALGRTFLDLLGASRERHDGPVRDERLRDRLRAHLHENLADPELTPRSAADAIGISERTVHALFAGSGTTCRRWIIEERLKRAAAALRAPEWRGASVSDIAFRLGFNDLSHFSRRFKERYLLSPRDYRDAAGEG
ncbi:helix-turn-helix domain-containing protein [Microbaculum marinum]|uniref:Helix-turn-helix domain-containing protein n=1 Tax=Microbaculum marinum TaxID=1764581 RepID=A0AAW9RZ77_9HYPH